MQHAPLLGVLQGRLTPPHGRGIQFFPDKNGEWEREFLLAKQAKLSCIELLVRTTSFDSGHPLLSSQGRKRIRELSKKHNITIPSIHAFYAQTNEYRLQLQRIVDASQQLGASTILLSFFKDRALSSVHDKTWDTAFAQIQPAATLVAGTRIKFGIEAELPAETLVRFIEASGFSEVLGVYYDLGNQFACGFPVEDEILFLKDRIVGVHIKDRLENNPNNPGIESTSVPLGRGCADFRGAFHALRKIEYTRPLILQGARTKENEVSLHNTYREYVEGLLEDTWI